MNHTLLREEITFFEGLKYVTYNDSEGLLTGGIGHRSIEHVQQILDINPS